MSTERREDLWLELALLKERFMTSFQEDVVAPVRGELLRIQMRLRDEEAMLAGGLPSDDAATIANELAIVAKALHMLDAEVIRFYGLSLRDAPGPPSA